MQAQQSNPHFNTSNHRHHSGRPKLGGLTRDALPLALVTILLLGASGRQAQAGGRQQADSRAARPNGTTARVDLAQHELTRPHQAGYKQKPPRGYCIRMSRAIKASSRCFKHLVQLDDDLNRLVELPAASRATEANTPTSKPNGTSRSSPPPSPAPQPHRRHEELVYVRFETLGDKITNLSTQSINEHLINGLVERLLLPLPSSPPLGAAAAATTTRTNASTRGADEADEMARLHMQIAAGLPAGDCALAIEKFLCRLVYPSCHFRAIDVVALVRPPCREDCLTLREHTCAHLNWTQLSETIQRAFRLTLMSTINALDLLVDGDQSANPSASLIDLIAPGRSANSSSQEWRHSLNSSPNDTSRSNKSTNANNTNDNSNSNNNNNNMSSSIHFYWPHERSIERCESLPAAWPHSNSLMYSAISTTNTKTGPIESTTALKAKQLKRWFQSHQARNYWPLCSNAHLAEANELFS